MENKETTIIRQIHPFLPIFTDVNRSYEFLLDLNILKKEFNCPSCQSEMKVKSKLSSINLRVFKCAYNKCRNTRLITSGSKLHFINISIDKFLKIIYTYVFNFNNYQAMNFCQISEPTLIKFKDFITNSLFVEDIKLGGDGYAVQIDETAICNGLIIKYLSSTLDNKKGVQWIL